MNKNKPKLQTSVTPEQLEEAYSYYRDHRMDLFAQAKLDSDSAVIFYGAGRLYEMKPWGGTAAYLFYAYELHTTAAEAQS